MTCEPFVIAPGMKWGTLVLSATAEAPLGEAEIEIVGSTELDGAKVERKARGGVVVWDTGNTPADSRITRSIVLAVRENAPLRVTASTPQTTLTPDESLQIEFEIARRPEYPIAVQLNGAGYPLPAGLEIPITPIPADQNRASLSLKLERVNPGTYSFIVNAEAQVPFQLGPNNKPTIRCLFPSNVVTFTVLPREPK